MSVYNHTRSQTSATGQRNYRLASNPPPAPAGLIPLGPIPGRIHGDHSDILIFTQLEQRLQDEAPAFLEPNKRIRIMPMPTLPKIQAYIRTYPRTRSSPRKPEVSPISVKPPMQMSAPAAAKTSATTSVPPSESESSSGEGPSQGKTARPKPNTRSSAKIDNYDDMPDLIDQSSSDEDEDPKKRNFFGNLPKLNEPKPPGETERERYRRKQRQEASDYNEIRCEILSSDESSDIDHRRIQAHTDSDRSDSDVERTHSCLFAGASEKARRAYSEAMKIYTDTSTLNLLMNNSNQARSDVIFDDIIYPAISPEIRLSIQHCRPELNIRSALSIIHDRIVITNRMAYLAHLRDMLHSTRLLPGDSINMLTGRMDLIHKAITRLNGAPLPSDQDFGSS